MSDPLEEMFSDLFGSARNDERTVPQLQLEIASLREKLSEEKARNDRLKKKARRLIDVAYNKALDAAVHIVRTDQLDTIAEILLLKRTVREE